MFKKKKNINFLELTPVHNKNFEEQNGLITIVFPKFKSKFLQWLIPKSKPPNIRISLDKIGSSVWKYIDGNSKVEEIIKRLQNEFGEELIQAEQRTLKFLTLLYQNSFIYFKELKKE
ncbi:MAG: PqqD family protein [Ignavibacteria bacterium]|nr:PqqD family protein [Ignavibacteria bacterium]